MSKPSKIHRRGNQSRPAWVVTGKFSRAALCACGAVVVALILGIGWWSAKSGARSQFEKLIGRWQRPDGGYVLEIKSVAAGGAMDAGYFNPKAIHVGKAEASRDGDATKVFIELRDVNYPGSSYTLTYEPASDQLQGVYFQAVERQRFAVTFLRLR